MATALTLKMIRNGQLVGSKDFDRDMIKIGRLASAHLVVEDEKVSRIHAVLEVASDGSMSLTDMGSVEGTFVNGQKVASKVPVAFGDLFRIGDTEIHLVQGGATSVEAISETPTSLVDASKFVAPAPAMTLPAFPAVQAPSAHTTAPPAPAIPTTTQPAAAGPGVRNEATGMPARIRPIRRKGGGDLGLELRFFWGDQLVGSHFLQPKKGKTVSFTVGSAPKVNFEMGDSRLGAPSFAVAVMEDGRDAKIRFTKKMAGELERKNGQEVVTLEQALGSRHAQSDGDAYAVDLGKEDFMWVDLGGVTVEAFYQPAPKPVFVPFAETIDYVWMNTLLVSLFLGAMFVISAVNKDLEGEDLADDLAGDQARLAKLIIKPPEPQKAMGKQKKDSGEMAAKHKDAEGQAGKKDAPKRSAHMAPKGDPNNKDQARLLMQKVFGGASGGVSSVFGHQGLGGELKAAMGNLFGAAPGDAAGFGGLGIRGSGSGGGGVGDTIGIGGIGTKGRGGGTGGYGSGIGVLGGKQNVDIGINSSEATVLGSLDKELIRKVIRENIQKIRFCYENAMVRAPKLRGKVSVKFVISAEGTVSASNVAPGTDTNNAELETCIVSRMRGFVFPKPKGGGVVVVTYPFVFQPGGQ